MQHVKTSRDFAIPATTRHQSRESIDSAERCRSTYKSILPHGSMVRARLVDGLRGNRWYHVTRADDSTSALARLDAEMAQLRNAGLTEAEMMAMEQHVQRTREMLYGDASVRPLEELDPEDFESDTDEERLEKARARGDYTPDTLVLEAKANLRQAAASTEKARTLYYMARIAGAHATTPATVRAATGVKPMGRLVAERCSDGMGSIYTTRQQYGRGR